MKKRKVLIDDDVFFAVGSELHRIGGRGMCTKSKRIKVKKIKQSIPKILKEVLNAYKRD